MKNTIKAMLITFVVMVALGAALQAAGLFEYGTLSFYLSAALLGMAGAVAWILSYRWAGQPASSE